MKKIGWLNHFLNFTAVILGVFLAFYIGDRANEKKEKQELKEILVSLTEELTNDAETFDEFQIPVNIEQHETLEKLIKSILSNNTDSVKEQFAATFDIQNYRPVSSTYLSITSSGKINLIHDLEIKKELSNYYDVLSEEAEKKGEVQVDYFLNQVVPWLVDNTNFLNVDADDLLGDVQFANRLILYRSFIASKTEQYKTISKAAKSLKSRLEKLNESI